MVEAVDQATAQRTSPQRRVAIVFWEGYLGVSPTLLSAITLLAERGFGVDVLMRRARGEYPQPPALPDGVCVRELEPLSAAWGPRLRTMSGTWRAAVKAALLLADVLQMIVHGRRVSPAEKWLCVAGVDTYGLVVASALPRRRLMFWSLELAFLREYRNPVKRAFKRTERWLSRRAEWSLVQDAQRADALVAENGMAPERVVLVPNSPAGPAYKERHNRFHQALNLPEATRIVLHLGAVDPTFLSLELATASNHWPADWVTVFHERRSRHIGEPYLQQVAAAGGERVKFSLRPVPYNELDPLVASADVGLVFYRESRGPNFSLVSGASGKLAHYLRCGVPVICLDLPGMRDVIEAYGCGVCVADVSQIGAALDRIWSNHDAYRTAAWRCYEERYEFGRHFSRVIDQLASHPASREAVRARDGVVESEDQP